eukprot:sb/3471579/
MYYNISSKNSELTETSKQPIRPRYLRHMTGYQPIRDKYFLIGSFPVLTCNSVVGNNSPCQFKGRLTECLSEHWPDPILASEIGLTAECCTFDNYNLMNCCYTCGYDPPESSVMVRITPLQQHHETVYQEPTKTSKQPIRTRYLGHLTGYQPIRDQYFLVRSVQLTNSITCFCGGEGYFHCP